MKIPDTYFNTLLDQDDAVDAVATLSGFWANRLDETHVRFGLSPPEYAVQLVLIYTGEVQNGGHPQFFLNRGMERTQDTVSALQAVSLADLASLLEEAVDIVHRAARDNDGNFMDGAAKPSSMDQLDRKVWRLTSGVDRALQEHLRRHASSILVPERGLQR